MLSPNQRRGGHNCAHWPGKPQMFPAVRFSLSGLVSLLLEPESLTLVGARFDRRHPLCILDIPPYGARHP
jgi:hypothetical protein